MSSDRDFFRDVINSLHLKKYITERQDRRNFEMVRSYFHSFSAS